MFSIRLLAATLAVSSLLTSSVLAHSDDLHFTHPLIAESPSPDTKLRLDVFAGDASEGDFATLRLEGEYAFARSLSVEVDVPYAWLSSSGAAHAQHLAPIGVALKAASYAFEDSGWLLGGGLELALPTGNEADGIGFERGVEVEPFVDFGWQRDNFQLIGFLHAGMPTSGGSQEADVELGWNLAGIATLHPRIKLLLEVDGATAFGGDEDGVTIVNLTPGMKFTLWRELDLGLGVSFPLTREAEFEAQGVVSVFWHF